MGGAVSTGRNNDDLVDNLLDASYIRTSEVQKLFRAIDRADYFLPQGRKNAYKDLAWKSGNLHLSAPCIYSEVMEGLCLKPNLSFLNLGSGTGYLSTMVGLAIGSGGINHGIELYPEVINYAIQKLEEFKRCCAAIDEYDLCEPKFVQGNCLCLSSGTLQYDRVYCGGACPPAHINYVKNLIKVGGILVMPVEDQLMQIERTSETSWEEHCLLPVSFATLISPEDGSLELVNMMDVEPSSLQDICRTVVRNVLRNNINKEFPALVSPKRKLTSKRKHAFKRSIIPHLRTPNEEDEPQVSRDRSFDRPSSGIQNRSIGAFIDIVLGRVPDATSSTEHNTSTQTTESDNKTEKQENDEEHVSDTKLQESNDLHNSTSRNTTASQSMNLQDADVNNSNTNGTVIARIMIRKRNRDVGIEEEEDDDNSEEDCSSESISSSTTSKPKADETSATKTKREKFDSGLGDEILSSSSEGETSHESNRQRNRMDVDSSADSDSEDESKALREHAEKFSSTRGRQWRTVTVPTYAVDHLLGHFEDESDDDSATIAPRQPVLGPYTILMRNKIQALPLPQTLKRYLNYYREF